MPPPYDRKKKMVVPSALRVLRLKPGRKFCTIKVRLRRRLLAPSAWSPTDVAQRLSHEVGWSYRDVVDRLEEKRKVKASAFHERKVRCAPTVRTGGLTSFRPLRSRCAPRCSRRTSPPSLSPTSSPSTATDRIPRPVLSPSHPLENRNVHRVFSLCNSMCPVFVPLAVSALNEIDLPRRGVTLAFEPSTFS